MDLKSYYQKIRGIEESISAEHVVVVSLETPDGGKAGQLAEVRRSVAAKMIVDRKATLAAPELAKEYRRQLEQAKCAADGQTCAQASGISMPKPPTGDAEKHR